MELGVSPSRNPNLVLVCLCAWARLRAARCEVHDSEDVVQPLSQRHAQPPERCPHLVDTVEHDGAAAVEISKEPMRLARLAVKECLHLQALPLEAGSQRGQILASQQALVGRWERALDV